jgi:hypothetical protein
MNGDFYYYGKINEDGLARAYIPFQTMNQVFSPSEALKKGTLFPELYKPYEIRDIYGGGLNG